MLKRVKRGATQASLFALTGFLLATPAHAALDELIVTAQKREQNIQNVPIAVSAFGSEFLQNTGFENVYDLADYSPGLVLTQSQTSTQATISLRGVGTSSNNAGLEPSVGVFIDGVYRSRTGAAVLDFVDIERIEVLRGPQGTLFGKNTSSGALNIVTKAPEYDFGGQFEASFGNLEYSSVKGTLTGPVVDDKLAARIAGYVTHRDGYIDNIASGSEINDSNRWGLRGQLLFNPNEDWDVRFIADYTEADEKCCGGVTLVNGPTDLAVAALGGTVIPGSQFGERNVAITSDPMSEAEDYGASLEINWDIGGHTITSITGWRNYEFFGQFDADFTDIDFLPVNRQVWDQEAWTQEIRISNNDGERFEYTLGAYYFTQDLNLNESIRFGADSSAYIAAIRALDPLVSEEFSALLMADINAVVDPAALTAADPFPDGSGINDFYEQEHESWALFAHTTFHVTDQFSITAGLRYVDEHKELTAAFNEVPFDNGVTIPAGTLPVSGTIDFGGGPINIPPGFTIPDTVNLFEAFQPTSPLVGEGFTSEFSDEAFAGTFKLQYQWTDDLLTYASYSRGYKSGGTNVTRVIPPLPFDFKPEEVDSYEIGFKGDLLDNRLRLNIAAYLADYSEFQDNTFLGNQFILQNAGKIEAKGVEAEAYATPTDWLTLESQVTWQDITYEEFLSGPCQSIESITGTNAGEFPDSCDRSGGTLSNTPEWTIHGAATAERALGGGGVIGFVRGEFTWRDDQVTGTSNDPRGDQEAYTNVGARLGVRAEDSSWEVVLWGKNLTDDDWQILHFDGVLQGGDPITVTPGKLYAYPNEPRTYGITLRTQF